MITKHANLRMQQRAIPPFALEILERYGSSMRHDGHDVLFMDKAAHKRVAAALGGWRACRLIEPWLATYLRMENGKVITVAHRTGRLKRNCNSRQAQH